MDFAYLDQSIAPLIDQLDHRHLNDIIDNPTCENVAQWIMDSHKPHIAWSVKVWETPKCWAMAMNPDGFWRAKDRGE
jgi:6-pyruvoyl-tetrahydropterin synthase